MKLISGAEFALGWLRGCDGFDLDAGTGWVLRKEGVGFGLEACGHSACGFCDQDATIGLDEANLYNRGSVDLAGVGDKFLHELARFGSGF